jgi:arylamine N-acetyltransferase
MSPSARDRLESTSTHKIFRILFAEYSTDQIDRYLEYISIPAQYRREAQPKLDLEFLTALHTHQLATIPYENLAMHYSTDHLVYLDPQILYKKLTTNGRGGYCMENCIFYNHVLQALGFSVYTTGVRIRFRVDGVPQGNYRGL